MCLIFIVIFFVAASVSAFNFDTNFPIVYTNPTGEQDYFGYSLILYEGSSTSLPWIQIGQPKGRNPFESYNETGNVYRCGIKEQCKKLEASSGNNIPGAFIGNSMDISPSGETFAVCGHRWIEDVKSDYYSEGVCYWGYTNEESTIQKKPFYQINDLQVVSGDKRVYNYAQGQAGFSVHFVNTGNSDTDVLLLGAPGVYNWAGIALELKDKQHFSPPPARRAKRAVDRNDKLNQFIIPPGTSSNEKAFHLFGYSVTSGRFYEENQIYYAAGVPRKEMSGGVVIFRITSDEGTNLIPKSGEKIMGSRYGEYFGAALAAANVNGDKYTDLIIGAPSFKSQKYDEGKVYIYHGSKASLQYKDYITGKVAAGRFGEAIVALGDIDYDGYEDIAVSAPYEDNGSGVVYIYRGSQDGINKKESQVIAGKQFIPNVQGFGYGIARPHDIDENNYKDLAIGAYKSGHAVIFRARPVIILQSNLTKSIDKINTNTRTFQLHFCVSFTCKKCVPITGIVVRPTVSVDERLKRASLVTQPENIQLSSPGQEICSTYDINVKDNIANLYDSLPIKISLSLIESKPESEVIQITPNAISGKDEFCNFCPVLDPESRVITEERMVFHLGCGDDNICNSRLVFASTFKDHSNNIFIIGSQMYLTLETTVTNKGENAYLTEVTLTFPSDVKLRRLPSVCKESYNVTAIVCSVDDPLTSGSIKSIAWEFDMEQINIGNATTLDFGVLISTNSENKQNNFTALQILAQKQADIEVDGKSKDQYYPFENTSSTVEFSQILQIKKHGPSDILDVDVEIFVPTTLGGNIFLEVYQPTVNSPGAQCNHLEGQPRHYSDEDNYEATIRNVTTNDFEQFYNRSIFVNCSNHDFGCTTIYCRIHDFKRSVVEVQLKFKLDISKIQDYLGENDVIIVATKNFASIMDKDIHITSSPYSHGVHIVSALIGPNVQKSIPIWIIIAAVLGGILLLCIIVFIMYKLNFFRRAQKEKLLAEKTEAAESEPMKPLSTQEEE